MKHQGIPLTNHHGCGKAFRNISLIYSMVQRFSFYKNDSKKSQLLTQTIPSLLSFFCFLFGFSAGAKKRRNNDIKSMYNNHTTTSCVLLQHTFLEKNIDYIVFHCIYTACIEKKTFLQDILLRSVYQRKYLASYVTSVE